MAMESYKRGLIAGMELAIRICRNRSYDRKRMGRDDQEALVCEGMIRIVQVEIGAGRQALPEFTIEEQEEINRIALTTARTNQWKTNQH